VSEIVQDGVSGYVCNSVDELAARAANLELTPIAIHRYAKERFSVDRMAAQYCRLYQELITGTVAALDSPPAKRQIGRTIRPSFDNRKPA